MNPEDTDYRAILPTGDELRVLLIQPYVTTSLLRKVLRGRGVFTDAKEKKDLVTLLLLSFITPDEFEMIVEAARRSQDTPKMRSHVFNLKTDDLSLAALLPDDLNVNQIAGDPFGNYEFLGAPSFVRMDKGGQEVYSLDYEIKTTDLTSDWIKSNRVYSGELTYRYDRAQKMLAVETIHSSDETKLINRKLSAKVDRHLKEQGIFEGDPERIRFNSFDNESRIRFFMMFTGKFEGSRFMFDKLTDLSLKLDESKPTKSKELEWMRDKVSSIKLGGKAIQETFFVTEISCRPFVIFHRIECRYKFEVTGSEGSFVAVFDFPESQRYPNSEFQISISSISIKDHSGDTQLAEKLKRRFRNELNQSKMDFYRRSRPKPVSANSEFPGPQPVSAQRRKTSGFAGIPTSIGNND
jgi:hypothetical protein